MGYVGGTQDRGCFTDLTSTPTGNHFIITSPEESPPSESDFALNSHSESHDSLTCFESRDSSKVPHTPNKTRQAAT